MMHKAHLSYKRCPIVFQGHPSSLKVTRLKNHGFWPKLGVSGLLLKFEFTNGYEMMHKAWSSIGALLFLAATKQLYKWYFSSVCPSVPPFLLCSNHRIIMQFSGVITNDQSKVHATDQGQRSKVKVTEVKTQLSRFRTVTPVWIHIWWWNGAHSLMLLRRGALLFFKVIRQISRSRGSEKRRIWPRLGVSGL